MRLKTHEEKNLIFRNFTKGILVALSIICSNFSAAESSDVSPLAVSLFPPLQLPSSGYSIRGLRLSVVGVHREFRGLDLALLGNVTDVTFTGFAISGLFNYNGGHSTVIGLQLAGLANLNSASSEIYGVQIAAYNNAGTVHGLQLGLLNIANELHGVQIGIFNINKAGPFRGSPIINAAF
jgi:hypothetical protein